jgi:cytochrome c-type biogenesis protein CcmH/NrfG
MMTVFPQRNRWYVGKGVEMKRNIALPVICLIVLVLSGQSFADNAIEPAQKLFAEQEYRKAIRHLKDLTKENPSSVEGWLLMGKCYTALKKEKKAAEAYTKVIQIDPDHEEANFLLGMSYSRLEAHLNAIEAFRRVIAVNPKNAQAHFFLGVSYDQVARLTDAFEQYKILKTMDTKLADDLRTIIMD